MGSMDEYENVTFPIGGFLNFKKLQLRFKNSAELQRAIPGCAVYLADCSHSI